jgi:hypothetical protein
MGKWRKGGLWRNTFPAPWERLIANCSLSEENEKASNTKYLLEEHKASFIRYFSSSYP